MGTNQLLPARVRVLWRAGVWIVWMLYRGSSIGLFVHRKVIIVVSNFLLWKDDCNSRCRSNPYLVPRYQAGQGSLQYDSVLGCINHSLSLLGLKYIIWFPCHRLPNVSSPETKSLRVKRSWTNISKQMKKGKQKCPGRATSRSRCQPLTPGGRKNVTQNNVPDKLYQIWE